MAKKSIITTIGAALVAAACLPSVALADWRISGFTTEVYNLRFNTPEAAHNYAVDLHIIENSHKGTYLSDALFPGPSYAPERYDTKVCFRYLNYNQEGTYDPIACTGSINTVYPVYSFILPVNTEDSIFLDLDSGEPEAGTCVGNPINAATGNKFQAETDYRSAGPEPLVFERFYNSSANFPTVNTTAMGSWTHTYSAFIEIDTPRLGANQVVLHRPWGEELMFYRKRDVWEAAWDTQDKLFEVDGTYSPEYRIDADGTLFTHNATMTNAGWRFERSDSVVEHYNSDGQLVRMDYPSGNQIRLTYTNGLLASVSDGFGRTLSFQHNAGQISAVVTPENDIISYTYANGLLTGIEWPDSSDRAYLYDDLDAPGLLAGIEDERGVRVSTWDYNAEGKAIGSESADGANAISLTYNQDGTTTVTNALGHDQIYSFSKRNGKLKIDSVEGAPCTGFVGGTQTYTYSSAGYVTQTEDPAGTKRNFRFNSRGLEVRRTTIDGLVIDTEWHTDFEKPVEITTPKLETTLTYDNKERVLSRTVTERSGAKTSRGWTFTYHADGPTGPNGEPGVPGQLASIDGPRLDVSDVTTFTYDGQGNMQQVVNALGHTTTFSQYDANGRPGSMVDANGVQYTFTYDFRGQLLTSTGPDGVTTFGYDPSGLLISQTQPNGVTLTYEYDDARRLVAIEDGMGNRNELTLDLLGSATEEVLKDDTGIAQWFQSNNFNEIGWLLSSTNALGKTTQYVYDVVANLTSLKDPADDEYTFEYDNYRRNTRITDPLNGLTRFNWNTSVELTRIYDPRSRYTNYSRNGFSEPTLIASPDAGNTSFTYDDAGNVSTRTDAKGQVNTYTYDALNRLTGITTSVAGEDAVVFTYDEPTAAYGVGRLTTVTQGPAVTSFTYTARGDVATVTQTLNGQSITVSYEYDGGGQLKKVHYPAGRIVEYTRDAAGQVTNVTTSQNGLNVQTLASGIERAPFGPITGLLHGNGLQENRTLDQAYQTIEITVQGLLARTYAYTDDGNISTINAQAFEYDPVDRLTSALGAYGDLDFEYDLSGNRRAEIRDGIRDTYTIPSANNRLLTRSQGPVSYTYDANGNTITRGAATFTYDSQNRLISATVGGTTAAYTYNFLSQRTSKTVGSATTLYVYGPAGELLAEVDGATGDTLREYVWLDEVPLAFVDASGVYQIHTDHLGTPIALTDGVGLPAWQADYEPFGAVTTTGAVEFNLRMPGQYFDTETGLHYNWNRYYDPATGRYLSYDPIGLEGGINPYLYAVANPLSNFDSEGTAVETAWDAYNVAVGINQTYQDLRAGDYWNATISALATCGDFIATAIPGIPGGASVAVMMTRNSADVAKHVHIKPRQIEAKWGVVKYKRGGEMLAIEHINYRHAFNSGFERVSRFSQGTSVKDIGRYVDDALRYGTIKDLGPNAYTVEKRFEKPIGTTASGEQASNIRVIVRDGIIQTAFPF